MITTTEGGVFANWWHALDLSPASAHRLITMLARHGLVQRNPQFGQYQVGTEFFRLALKLSSHFGIWNVRIPVMQA